MVELEVPRYKAKKHLREVQNTEEQQRLQREREGENWNSNRYQFFPELEISRNTSTEQDVNKKITGNMILRQTRNLNKETEIEQLKKLLIENHEESQKDLQEMKNLVQENNKEAEIEQLKEMLKENHEENRKEIEELKNNCMKMFKCIKIHFL